MAAGSGSELGSERDRGLAVGIERWFSEHARPLPWREVDGSGQRDPWRSLVSEAMLQQTQVSRVAERFEGFLERFPSPTAMVEAGEDAVVAAWSGLGYYRRARMLFAAAVAIFEEHGGEVPRGARELVKLPGVGRYTAGAIASIVFGQREALVDGNVVRVLLRIEGRDGAMGDRASERWVWERAGELVAEAEQPGVLNEGLMELGATVCTPGETASCLVCPVRRACRAAATGRVGEIPRPKERAKQKVLHAAAVVHVDGKGRVLLERRGERGLWAGMWQVLTVEGEGPLDEEALREGTGASKLERLGSFVHTTTHREVRFVVYRGQGVRKRAGQERRAVDELLGGAAGANELGISNATRRVLEVWRGASVEAEDGSGG